ASAASGGPRLDPKELRICDHNTVGFKCDQCADGYYGNASSGVPDACKPCPCPATPPDLRSGQVICTPLPGGPVGNSMRHLRVELLRQAAQLPQVCHPDTGVCTKCIHETGGDKCERCKNGYYGNALATSGVKCRSCGCHPAAGTNLTATCNPVSGECQCLPNVDGRRASSTSAAGRVGEFCACNYTGTGGSATCHARHRRLQLPVRSGRAEVRLLPARFFNFTERGCTPCQCNPLGIRDPAQVMLTPSATPAGSAAASSTLLAPSAIAALKTGSTSHAMPEVPDCYGVVQQLVNDLRSELAIIETLFDQTPNISAVGDVRGKLERARDRAIRLVRYLETLLGPGLSQTNQRLMQNLSRMLDEASNNLAKADTDLNQAQTFCQVACQLSNESCNSLEIDAKLRPINVTLEQAQALLQDYLGLAGDVNKTNTDLL
uniref:Laminin EGF-like domain-containing protein n=1 Tax=Macrostomum lignano TaxID=282301 RepID=A0A1I8IZ29_9PLAT